MTATANGAWYFHVKAYNGDDVANGTSVYGPFYYDNDATISSTSPFNNEIDVTINAPVTITWAKDVDCSTVTTSTITIDSPVGWTKSSCSNNQSVFTPAGQSATTTYTVTVTSGVKDTNGIAMTAGYPFSYNTAAP